MNELIEFLTSKDIIIVYCVSFLACLLCFVIYIVEKNSENYKKKHNTRELNKLVAQIKDRFTEAEPIEVMEEPVLTIDDQSSAVNDMLESTLQLDSIEKLEDIDEIADEEPLIIEDIDIVEDIDEPELEYTTIEPDQATAKLELEKIKEELQKQEQQEVENITLTNYETEQEENAIISLEELIKKGKEMYESNEVTQYADEGNEPISLNELAGLRSNDAYEQPFVIADAVGDDVEVLEEEPQLTIAEQVSIENSENVRLEDATKVVQTEVKNEARKFKSSPIISPIYGIENTESVNELELENTANYDKLDEEIKKTNEFIMTLKELQGKLN